MAEALILDPGDYGGTYKLIGGRPSLDFANLVSFRGTAREHDWLRPWTNLRRWAAAAEVPATGGITVSALLELRERLARVFLAVADGQAPVPSEVVAIGRLASEALGTRTLQADGTTVHWHHPSPTLPGLLALDAADLLTTTNLAGRIRACPGCRWVFLDTTRNHRRTWCDPADCGNRARQQRHYQRLRKAGSATNR